MICYFFVVCFVFAPTLEETVEGIFVIKVIVSSRRTADQMCWVRPKIRPTPCIVWPKIGAREGMLINMYKTALNCPSREQFATQGHPELQVTPFYI